MKCSDFQRVLPELLDGAQDDAFQAEVETHLESCTDCSSLVSDLELISREARQLEATEEPPERVWVRIAAELRAEGLVREPDSIPGFAPSRPVLVQTPPRRRWSALWLAPIAAALVAAGSYVIGHKPTPTVAKQDNSPAQVTTPAPVAPQVAQAHPVATPAAIPAATSRPAPVQVANKSAQPTPTLEAETEPESLADDQQFLSAVSTRAPALRATYENQLQAVNADIRETQAYVNRNPGDVDARQHLMDAYEQKALLYQIALDRIQ
jgi:Putative zinc-finger